MIATKETCYGCDYFFKMEELTEIVEPHLPAGIKLCGDCMDKVGGKSDE